MCQKPMILTNFAHHAFRRSHGWEITNNPHIMSFLHINSLGISSDSRKLCGCELCLDPLATYKNLPCTSPIENLVTSPQIGGVEHKIPVFITCDKDRNVI